MQPGAMLVYRGDLPPAEVASSKRNLRIQGCVNVDGIDHDAGVVERVAWAFYRCVHCFKRCDGKRALSNHVRYCNDSPDKEKIATKRKQNNDKGAYCKVCKHHFGKKNTYDAHNCHGADGRDGSIDGDNADDSTEK
ncbi:hypothetical protein PF008_g4645 [Phytophthora fragariae]|uniref:Uncharacterized protein n=1 Tax=Phytophthora fragariae TaxID=53985 RepID=A0A6G0SCK2_9STRA|nr:hypothetical protein PF008_g4645 [Phytophthora fragariae]